MSESFCWLVSVSGGDGEVMDTFFDSFTYSVIVSGVGEAMKECWDSYESFASISTTAFYGWWIENQISS